MKLHLVPFAVVAIFTSTFAHAIDCWNQTARDANNPIPWVDVTQSNCDQTTYLHPVGSTTDQTIGEEHRNWHCTFDEQSTEAYGRAFLAFHRQFIQDFDIVRLGDGIDRLEFWDPYEDAPVPGNFEDLSFGFTHCSVATDTRAAGALCADCVDLADTFKVGLGLEDFTSLGALGNALELGTGWHGTYHNGVQALGCTDIGGFINTSRDPAFWMAHKKLDEISRDWQTLKAADVVIVLDRSGSMDDNCASLPPPPGTDCAIEDARQAARTFADTVLDVRMDGSSPAAQQHRIGLVSFANTGTPEVGLTPANGIVATSSTPFSVALNAISAGGGTSVGAGIRAAVTMLNGATSPNPHQAILVLTDGKENVAPCLGGNSPGSCSSPDVLTASEIGNIQVISVGFGPGALEANLRDVSERHGGVFFAQEDISASLDLQKFFITASGEIFDAAVSLDPKGRISGNQDAAERFELPVCGDERISVVLGYENPAPGKCDLELEVFTPSGEKVDRNAQGVEAGHAPRHDFLHVNLPYKDKHAAGTWTGRIVHAANSTRRCESQEYFYSALAKGTGRVAPFPARPRIFLGRPILGAFRISESNRPKGGYDSVRAQLTLTRPNGEQSVHTLNDKGVQGDKLAGNNIWSVEIPDAATKPGPYHLHGRFILEKNGCSKIRESEYSIVVERESDKPASVACGGKVRVRPGDERRLDGIACLWNQTARAARYSVEVKDSEGWLQKPARFTTAEVPKFERLCFGRGRQSKENAEGGDPIFAAIPDGLKVGAESLLSVNIRPLRQETDETLNCFVQMQVVPPYDCNGNGVDDADEIKKRIVKDKNQDGVPDECQNKMQYRINDVVKKWKSKY